MQVEYTSDKLAITLAILLTAVTFKFVIAQYLCAGWSRSRDLWAMHPPAVNGPPDVNGPPAVNLWAMALAQRLPPSQPQTGSQPARVVGWVAGW